MIKKTLDLFFPIAIAAVLFLMAKEAFNSSLPFALPASAVLSLAGILSVLYGISEIK